MSIICSLKYQLQPQISFVTSNEPHLWRKARYVLGQLLLNSEDRPDGLRRPRKRRGHETVAGHDELDSAHLAVLDRQLAHRLRPEVGRKLCPDRRLDVGRLQLVRLGQSLRGGQVEFRLPKSRLLKRRIRVAEVGDVLVVDERFLEILVRLCRHLKWNKSQIKRHLQRDQFVWVKSSQVTGRRLMFRRSWVRILAPYTG